MSPRPANEPHRAATPLELLFDLCFVVAVALAGSNLHHALIEHHIGDGVLHYAMVFFAIWWAWMNFTWFASSYDVDDVLYRLTTFVQIAGVLIMAAGLPRAFNNDDFGIATLGYVIMRLAMVSQWLRVYFGDAAHQGGALRYAIGLTVVQAGWVGLLFVPKELHLAGFGFLVLAELAVPVLAELSVRTSWHPHHIAERYGLFTLIVLGESILAATTAVQSAIEGGQGEVSLLGLAAAGLVIVFSMWWLYFDEPSGGRLTTMARAFTWGYGHLLVFASAAAVGVGLAVGVDYKTHTAHLSATEAGFMIAIPVSIFLISVWILQSALSRSTLGLAFPVTAALLLVTPFTGVSLYITALLIAALVVSKCLLVGTSSQQSEEV